MSDFLLSIKNLCIHYLSNNHFEPAVTDVSFDIKAGEVFGLAGESGCGKSTIAFAIARLTKLPGVISGGEIFFNDEDILQFSPTQLAKFRWSKTSLVFQSAMDALNPLLSIEEQIIDTLNAHHFGNKKQCQNRAQELLELVGIEPNRLQEFPHQFSGGMRQRIGIALALALQPKLIIMDEPTTALDVVVQRDIIERIYKLKDQFGFAVLFISHDLSLMAEFADRIGVMQGGKLLEIAPSNEIWSNPTHPYTKQLANAFLSLNQAPAANFESRVEVSKPVLELNHVSKDFKVKSGFLRSKKFRALHDVSFKLHKNRALALVGESGSGKSTCARLLSGVYPPSEGEILYHGKNIQQANKQQFQNAVQMIFQDPFGSLNPTLTIGYQLLRPLELHQKFNQPANNRSLQQRVIELLELVELTPASQFIDRYPHELSGGQRQRVAIARVLAVEPSIILADEPTSMLDVSLRTGILNLLKRLKEEMNLAFLYITHDLATAQYFAEDIAVMYAGRIVEWGETSQVINNPQHPYTKTLLKAIPDPQLHLRKRLTQAQPKKIWDPTGSGCVNAIQCTKNPCTHKKQPVKKINEQHFMREFDSTGA